MNSNIEPQFGAIESTLESSRGTIPWIRWPSAEGGFSGQQSVHFSAANGFTTASYSQFLLPFSQKFRVLASENRGAWEAEDPPHENWTWGDHADDLIAAIEALHNKPVIGIGHSIGGTVTLIAARKRPDLFSSIVVIDPATLPSKFISSLYPFCPRWLSFRLFPFIRGSHFRRRHWQSSEEFYNHYRDHPTYRKFTNRSLTDYARSGLRPSENGGYELSFSPHWESYNFRRVQYLWRELEKTSHPTLFLRAEHTYMYSQQRFENLNRGLPAQISAQVIPASGHLAPFEVPDRVSTQILNWLVNKADHSTQFKT